MARRTPNRQNRFILIDAFLDGGNFTDANLSHSDLSQANLVRADLSGADLSDSNLKGAKFNLANLDGTDLSGSDITGANFSKADLRNANFRNVRSTDSQFSEAHINSNSLGLGKLPQSQMGGMILDETLPVIESSSENEHDLKDQITVGRARKIIVPAHWALQEFSLPNDLTEEHRELFESLQDTVKELQEQLADLEDDDRLLSEENEKLRAKIKSSLPTWQDAWRAFVLGGSGAVGVAVVTAGVSKSAFAAGFIAGVLHDTFSSGEMCIT